jgi:DNA (cytosine-5)-methyltransferase 1
MRLRPGPEPLHDPSCPTRTSAHGVPTTSPGALRVAGLFAGIGGLELGFARAGHHAEFLCELDAAASAVLADRFPNVPLVGDVRDIERLPTVDLVAAGFPCQDLSQAGRTVGITGSQSGLVDEVFRALLLLPWVR